MISAGEQNRMKHFLKSIYTIVLLFLFQGTAWAQIHYTPYDEMPGMVKSYKPAYDENYPDWGKMLYQYPVNYFEVIDAFKRSGRKEDKALVRYYKLWVRHLNDWVDNGGNIHVPDMYQYYRKLYFIPDKNAFPQTKDDVSDWSLAGPKETFRVNYNGPSQPQKACSWQANVYAFDVAASDRNILYAGTETGFMNKSVDKGQTWQMLARDYFFGGGILAVAVNPVNPDIVYVAAGNQVHKSVDGGNSWTPLLPPDNLFSADRLIIDPENPDKIFAAANQGLYLTINGGNSWEKKWYVRAYDVVVRPGNSNYVYALTKQGVNFSVIESADGGDSFTPQTWFPASVYDKNGGLLAISQANPDKLWAIMLSSNDTPYLYKQDLITGIWELVATGKTPAFKMDNGQGYFDLVLDVSPLDENLIFVGTTTFFRSTDGGDHFTALGGYYGLYPLHPDFQDIKMLDDGDTWVSCDGGVYLTTDNYFTSSHWYALNKGLVGSDMWGYDQAWNEDLMVGGRYHNGNTAFAEYYGNKALRMGGGESPTGWILKGKLRHAAFNDIGTGWILPPTPDDPPQGRFLFSKYPNMDEYGGRRSNLVFHTNYFGTIILGEGNAIWKSTDMGVTYEMLHDFGHRVRYLVNSYSNPDVLYVDIKQRGLYRSDDGGETWERKPSLTGGEYGNANWNGKLFFAVSPFDANTIYACLQNGTWSADVGKIFKSSDGGDTWEDWTGSLSEYTKSLVVQSDSLGNDLVYLFTNAKNAKTAKVFVRKSGDNDWTTFDRHYPVGINVKIAMPFYRDAKLRVAGTAGVWETKLADTNFKPIINPWVEKAHYNCFNDTVYFEDHSIIKHAGTSWHWDITPSPAYISNADVRNPKVVLGSAGSYSVKLTVTRNGQTFVKEMPDMITATSCPSINDCDNPAEVPKFMWDLLYVDSEELGFPGKAVMAFDGDYSTIWHTRWSSGTDPYPHEIQVDMGQPYLVSQFVYYARQDGPNGRIKDYELYLTMDTLDWGEPVSTGEWTNTAAPQVIDLQPGVAGQYFKLVALSEVNGGPWASAAEFTVVGCTDITGTCPKKISTAVKAFPVPFAGVFTVSLPEENGMTYQIYSSSGRVVRKGTIPPGSAFHDFDMTGFAPGFYFLQMKSNTGVRYHVKLVKE